MELSRKFAGEANPEVNAEQYTESTEKSTALETKESPEDQKKEVLANIAGSLKNKVGMLKNVAKLKFGGMSPATTGLLLVSAVFFTKVIVSGAADFDINHIADLADAIHPEDHDLASLVHSHDHDAVSAVIPESDSGSHVTMETPEPTPEPPTKLEDEYGFLKKDDLMNQNNNYDSKYDEIMKSAHHHSGSGVSEVVPEKDTASQVVETVKTPETHTDAVVKTESHETAASGDGSNNHEGIKVDGEKHGVTKLGGEKHGVTKLGGKKYISRVASFFGKM